MLDEPEGYTAAPQKCSEERSAENCQAFWPSLASQPLPWAAAYEPVPRANPVREQQDRV